MAIIRKASDLRSIIRMPRGESISPIFVITLIDSETGEEYDTFREFVNWMDIETHLSRDGLSAVNVEDTQGFEFCRNSRKMIMRMFERDQIRAKGRIIIYRRGKYYHSDYTVLKDLEMDFGTLSDNDRRDVVTIEGRSSELQDYVKSNQSTNYDIPVSEVADTKPWRYSRMPITNYGRYVGPEEFENRLLRFVFTLPLYLQGTEQVPGSPEHDLKTQDFRAYWGPNDEPVTEYFFESAVDITLNIDLDFTLVIDDTLSMIYTLGFYVNGYLDESKPIWRRGNSGQKVFQIKESVKIGVRAGEKLSFALFRSNTTDANMYFTTFTKFEVSYIESGPQVGITVIRPNVLLQKFLDVITGRPNYIQSEIEWGDLPYIPMFAAAESIRNFDAAYIHSTVMKLFNWLKTMGYVYDFDKKTRKLIYKKRDAFYKREVSRKLSEREFANFIQEASIDNLYTAVKVAYPSAQNESINGRYAVNVPTDYSTGYVVADGKQLELATDYIADPITIELLCWQRDNPSTDNKRDNDIFVIAMEEMSDHWIEKRDIEIKINDNIFLFNAYLHPYYIIRQNESQIGISTDRLAFTGTEGYRDAVFYSRESSTEYPIQPYSDIPIRAKLIEPIAYKLDVGSRESFVIDDLKDGLIEFVWRNKKYKGYIADIYDNPANNRAHEWTLYASKFPEGIYAKIDPERVIIQSSGAMLSELFIECSGLEVASKPTWINSPMVGDIIPAGQNYANVTASVNSAEERTGTITLKSTEDPTVLFEITVIQTRKPGIKVSPEAVTNFRPGGGDQTFEVDHDGAWTAVVESTQSAEMLGTGTGVGKGTFEVRIYSSIGLPFNRFIFIKVYPNDDPTAYTRVSVEQQRW